MTLLQYLILLVLSIFGRIHGSHEQAPTEEEAVEYLRQLDEIFKAGMNAEMTARWNYITDITQEHEEAMVEIKNYSGSNGNLLFIRTKPGWRFKRPRRRLVAT